jgi:urease accessory protein
MRRAVEHLPALASPEDEAQVMPEVLATVTLPFDQRHRRRLRLRDDRGGEFLLDLPRAVAMRDGDLLRLEDGGCLAVRAADEDVLEIACANAEHAARVAWHLGNRHVAVQVLAGGRLRILEDRVLHHMLEGLGAAVRPALAPFAPEDGAYAGQGHHHDH